MRQSEWESQGAFPEVAFEGPTRLSAGLWRADEVDLEAVEGTSGAVAWEHRLYFGSSGVCVGGRSIARIARCPRRAKLSY